MKKIILASGSPRRKELLKTIGLEFESIPADIDETFSENFSNELIENLAYEKANWVAKKQTSPSLVIGSDTVVVIDNHILGKPKDKDDAKKMLQTLSDSNHQVISAIAIIDTGSNTILKDSVVSEVKFKKLSEFEIDRYVESGEPMDKAGAYAIQGHASVFVESIKGCYNNIVGISTFKLAQMLGKLGVEV